MKALKYITVSAILALGIAAPAASAQDDAAPGKGKQQQSQRSGRGFDMTAPLLKGITLTDDQQTKVDAIKADAQKQRAALAPEDIRTKGRELMQDTQAKLRAVLTADQQKVFDQNLKDLQSRFQGKGGPGGPGGKGGPGGRGSRGGKGGGAPKADAPAEE